LAFTPLEMRSPEPGEVQIRVRATGLNFRDVLIVLGMYPDPDAPIGGECAGEVIEVGEGVEGLAVGDRVMAMDPGAFGTLTNAPAELTVRIPDEVSFEEAASIPSAFVTVMYALRQLAGLKAGERVLIHAAAGGVGQAAVQLAQVVGAEIIATAGSPEKRAYLRDQGIEHVADSRSLEFVAAVREATGGEGVDVVLNSLADEFVTESFSLLKPGGRFVELGKRGILSPEQAAERRPDVAYHVVDLAAGTAQDPSAVGELLESVRVELAQGAIRPLPLQVFERNEVVDAFRFMAQARHVGKIVVVDEVSRAGVCRYPERGVRPDATYLITGGTGGLGLEVARWLAADGARHIALLSRRGPDERAEQVVAELQEQGVDVKLQRADVADADGLAEVFRTIADEMPPLAGVVHAAGILRDGVLVNQTWDRFGEVLAPKVQGAWNLHTLTRTSELDFFVMFSSISAVLGSPGEGNHAAANAFLDSLASVRRAAGLPAQSINWGVWSEVGAAAEHGVDARVESQGMGSMTPDEGVRALALVMQDDRALGAVMPVDWELYLSGADERIRTSFYDELGRTAAVADAPGATLAKVLDEIERLPEARRLTALANWVREQVRSVLGLDSVDAVPIDQPLQELGLDSLMAVELRNIVRTGLDLSVSLPSTLVFDYPTVDALARHLAGEVLGWGGAGPEAMETRQDENDELDATLSALESLSDEEVSKNLRARMTGES
jgi:NADPH:quinone reductase-like Zn-dependent oxidoreductase/acyl carrier protein